MNPKFNPINYIKIWRLKRKMLTIQDFAHMHRKYLVIVADPKDDSIFVSYRDKQITGVIKSADGFHHEIVKKVLKSSTFNSQIDRFLGGVVEILQCSLENGNNFYQFLDGALFNISKALRKKA